LSEIATYSRVLYLFGSPFREGVFMLKIKSQSEVFSCEKSQFQKSIQDKKR
jgi:hypothetical protein